MIKANTATLAVCILKKRLVTKYNPTVNNSDNAFFYFNCACDPSPAGHCINSSSIDPSSRSLHLSHFSLCPALPLPVSLFIISHTISHFKSILTFILHPSIQFLIILPPPILQIVSDPLLFALPSPSSTSVLSEKTFTASEL